MKARSLWPAIALLICMSAGSAVANDIAEVNYVLDTMEQAHRSHDIELLGSQYSDECMLVVWEGSQVTTGGLALSKEQILRGMQNQVWQSAGLQNQKLTGRRIGVQNDLAFVRMTTQTSYTNGKTESGEHFIVLVKRHSKWRVCFGMPAFVKGELTVASVRPGSAAEEAGLKPGDTIIACNGENLDPLVFGSDISAISNCGKGSEVSLLIRRPAKEFRVEVPSTLTGAKVEARLVPSGSARFIPSDEPHPVKDLLRQDIEMLRTGEVNGSQQIVCPSGFFSYRREPGRPTVLVTAQDFPRMVAKHVTESRAAIDPSAIEIESIGVIATANIALAAANLSVRERTGGLLRVPTRLQVYVRNGADWQLAGNLVERFRVEPAGPEPVELSPEATRQMDTNIRGAIVGIGVKLSVHQEGILIDQVLTRSPAETAGLVAGDVIVSVDGSTTKGLTIEEVVRAITGEEGTKVALELLRASGDRFSIGVPRATVAVPGVDAKLLPGGLGYLGISTFNVQTAGAVRAALTKSLSPQQARGILLDLRDCSGGLYPEVLKVAEMFLDGSSPKLLWIVRQDGKEPVSVRAKSAALVTSPCIVLIGEKTGGAAELLAAALQQHQRAKLVGRNSAGVAVMKERVLNPDGSSRVVQIGDFLFPQTGRTGTDGVVPDMSAPEDATPESVLKLAQESLAKLIDK